MTHEKGMRNIAKNSILIETKKYREINEYKAEEKDGGKC